MPTFIAEFLDLKIDVVGYRKSVDKLMEQQMRMAARAWLRAVIPHVPVYTGMARGSLRPLGQFLKISVPISPIATRKGMGIGAGESKSWFKISKSNGNYTFEYNSTVAHYEINEFYNVPLPLTNPTPWNSFKYGDAAFNTYAQTKMKDRIPRVQDFIKVGSIIVSR